MAGVPLQTIIVDDALKNSKEFGKKNITGQLPLLEPAEGATTIADSIAICKYLGKVGPEGRDLMGASPMEKIKVE